MDRTSRAGFAVQLLEHLNHSWPHAGHTIQNAALDATPLTAAIPCLFTHVVPGSLDVVIAESGSMAPFMKDVPRFSTIESFVRQLLSHGRAPVIILLSIRDWCKGGGRGDVLAAAEELRVRALRADVSRRAALQPLLAMAASTFRRRRPAARPQFSARRRLRGEGPERLPASAQVALAARRRPRAGMLAYAFDRAAARAAGPPRPTARRRRRPPLPPHEVNAAERPYAARREAVRDPARKRGAEAATSAVANGPMRPVRHRRLPRCPSNQQRLGTLPFAAGVARCLR